MNRPLEDRIANDLHEIARQAPISPTAWTDLVRRLDEPLDQRDPPMIALSSRSDPDTGAASDTGAPQRSTVRMLLGAAVAVSVLVGGVVLLPQGSDDHESAPGAAPTTDIPVDTSERMLPPPGGPLEPATYRTAQLGVSLTFTTDEQFVLGLSRPGQFVLLTSNVQANPKNDRAIIVTRVGGWNTREEATDVDFRGTGSIDPYDVELWASTNDIIVDDSTTSTVDGRPTTILDVRVDPASTMRHDGCSFSTAGGWPTTDDRVDWNPCFWYMSFSAAFDRGSGVRADLHFRMMGPSRSRLWVIEVEGEDPIVVEAAAPLDDTTFLDEVAASVVATFRFDATDPDESTGSSAAEGGT